MARVLLDQGSQASFILDTVAHLLNLPRERTDIRVSGLGSLSAGTARHSIQVTSCSLSSPIHKLNFSDLVLRKLTNLIPSVLIPPFNLAPLKGQSLADPGFRYPGKIHVIL